MLQSRLIVYKQCTLNLNRLSFVSHRFVSYDPHESPTVPHHIHPKPTLSLTDKLPSSCRVLIAGGGIIGQSIAYHLSQLGEKDIVLIEKAKLASGSTWQSSGRVSNLQNTFIETHFTKYSRELYERFHREGHDIGFMNKGSLWVAQTSDRLHTLKRQYSITKALGVDCEILNIEKLKDKVPFIDPYEIWVDLKLFE